MPSSKDSTQHAAQQPAEQAQKDEVAGSAQAVGHCAKAPGKQSLRGCAGDEIDILDGLDEELAVARKQDEKLRDESRRAVTGADDATPLIQLARSNIKLLLRNKHVGYARMLAFRWFLKRYKRSKWMQWQDRGQYPERIAISLLGNWTGSVPLAYCGLAGRLCQEPDHCPRCALRKRIKPALKEYENVYGSTLKDGTPLYCYAISPSFEWRAAYAGLHFVLEKGDEKQGKLPKVEHWHPWHDSKDAVPLTADDDVGDVNPIRQCFRLIFDLARALRACRVRGVLAHRHIAWHFFEKKGFPHHLTPNGHFLVVTDEPLNFETGKNMLELFGCLRARRKFGRRLFPDLHIEELTSQADVNRWIGYMFQPMDYVHPYMDAIRKGIDPVALNREVDDRVFQGGEVMLSVSSPHRFGVLRSNGNDYVGTVSVTQQRNQEALERKARRSKRQRPPGPAENHLHQQAKVDDLIQHEGDWEP